MSDQHEVVIEVPLVDPVDNPINRVGDEVNDAVDNTRGVRWWINELAFTWSTIPNFERFVFAIYSIYSTFAIAFAFLQTRMIIACLGLSISSVNNIGLRIVHRGETHQFILSMLVFFLMVFMYYLMYGFSKHDPTAGQMDAAVIHLMLTAGFLLL